MERQQVMQLVSQQTLASSAPALTKAAEFESLVHRYQNSVYSIALRMTGNPHKAQDLTQEAFVRAYRAFDSYRRGTSFDKWLYRIVTNLYIDEVRRRKRTPYTESLDQPISTHDGGTIERELPDSSTSPEEVFDRTHLDGRLQQALESLPPDFRMAVILCDIEGFSYEEIAQIMNTSIGTVRSRIHRGRRALREKLAPHLTEQGQEVIGI